MMEKLYSLPDWLVFLPPFVVLVLIIDIGFKLRNNHNHRQRYGVLVGTLVIYWLILTFLFLPWFTDKKLRYYAEQYLPAYGSAYTLVKVDKERNKYSWRYHIRDDSSAEQAETGMDELFLQANEKNNAGKDSICQIFKKETHIDEVIIEYDYKENVRASFFNRSQCGFAQ